MSINAVMSNALSGLLTAQTALRQTSNNVANVNTEGYARKIVATEAVVVGGVASGVRVGEIQRVADQFIEAETRLANAESARWQTLSDYQSRLQSLLGTPSDNTSLSGRIDRALSALASAATDPSSSILKRDAVARIGDAVREIASLAAEVQGLRTEADTRIGDLATTASDLMAQLDTVNRDIVRTRLVGDGASALEDRQAALLDQLSTIVDVRSTRNPDGSLTVTTSDGVVLVGQAGPYRLNYDPAGPAGPDTRFASVTVERFDRETGKAVAGSARSLDTHVAGGSLRALLDLRDTALPAVGEALGELAQGMDQLNAVHAQNSTYPPPVVMTGRQTGLDAGDRLAGAGDLDFLVMNDDGTIVEQVTVTANPAMTVADLMAAVNAGLTGAQLSFTDGVLSFAATGGGRVGVVEDGSFDRGGRGFVHFFGLNDVVRSSVGPGFETGLAASDAHRFSGTLDLSVTGPRGQDGGSWTVDFDALGGSMADVLAALNDPAGTGRFFLFSLDAGGELQVDARPGAEGYRLNVAGDATGRGTTGVSASDFFGLGAARARAAAGLTVEPGLAADPGRLALGRIDLARTPPLTAGDASGAAALAALQHSALAFDRAGNVAALSATLGGYAATLLTSLGQDAASAASGQETAAAVLDELERRRQSISGVNLDEELAQMIVFQNAYNAAARVMNTASEMYDVLLSIAQ